MSKDLNREAIILAIFGIIEAGFRFRLYGLRFQVSPETYNFVEPLLIVNC